MERTIDWDTDAIVTVDQCVLPREHRILRLTTVDDLIDAIKRLAIRGAPALGGWRARRCPIRPSPSWRRKYCPR